MVDWDGGEREVGGCDLKTNRGRWRLLIESSMETSVGGGWI